MEKIKNKTDNTNFTVGVTAHSTIDIYKFIKSYKSVLNSFKIYKQNNPTRSLPHVILAIDTVRPEGNDEWTIKDMEQFNQEVANFARKAEEMGLPLQIIETTDNIGMVSANRNNIINLCDTSHMVFVDGDDAIDEYAFDSIRKNIDKHKDKENSFITMDQDGRSVWNVLYKVSDLRKNDISFTKMYNEDGVFLGDLKLKEIDNIDGENVICHWSEYYNSNSVNKFYSHPLLNFVLQIFDHLSKHNINSLSFKPVDEKSTYNGTNFKNIFQYFSDNIEKYNGGLSLFNRDVDNKIYQGRDHGAIENILLSLSLYPEILDPTTEESKFFIKVNKKLKELFETKKELNTINLLEILSSINIDSISWNNTILPKIKENFCDNIIDPKNFFTNNYISTDLYFNNINDSLQNFTILIDNINKILNKTDNSKTLHILNDPSNVSTIIDYENYLSYDKLKTERSKEEIQMLIKRVLKGRLLPNKAYDYTTKTELQDIITNSTMSKIDKSKDISVQQFKKEKGIFTLKMFLENNITLSEDKFEELCNLIVETMIDPSLNIDREEISAIIQEYKEINKILLKYGVDNIGKEEVFTIQSKYVPKKKENGTKKSIDEMTVGELRLSEEQKEKLKKYLENFNISIPREYKLNLKNIDFIKLKDVLNNKHCNYNKNILFSGYIEDLEIFKILFKKHKEVYNNEEIFFDNENENILLSTKRNPKIFEFVLNEELEVFNSNQKQIFFDKEHSNILLYLTKNKELFKLVLDKELELGIDKDDIFFNKEYGNKKNILNFCTNNKELFESVLEKELKLNISKDDIFFNKEYGDRKNILNSLVYNTELFKFIFEKELEIFKDDLKQVFFDNYNKNLLSSLNNNKELFQFVLEKELELGIDKKQVFFDNYDKNILFNFDNKPELFQFVLEKELELFKDDPKQIFVDNKTKKIESLKILIDNLSDDNSIKLLIDKAIQVLDVDEFCTYIQHLWEFLHRKVEDNYIETSQEQLKLKQENINFQQVSNDLSKEEQQYQNNLSKIYNDLL